MKYRLIFPILEVHGSQWYTVEADSEEEAVSKHDSGESDYEGDYEGEEIDVQSLGRPEIQEVDPEK